jgi:cellulose synthase/poly-beta-1,6-N-acetylglucosamine synthase-like glycosyltransferase
MVWHRPRRPILYAKGDDLPAVDVLITCCGEPNHIILNVVRAACESDYPRDKLRVVLLDDGHDAELEQAISRLQERYPYAYYTAREKPEKPDFKAGNLNHGFRYTAGLSPVAPFIAGLDTDMVVRPGWLRSMIPHLIADPKLGMTNPPQYFYNIPANDHVRQDLDYFYALTELIHEGLGAADCVGSGYLVRRQAIDDIGGVPTCSISEDTGTSAMLLGKGWQVAYIDEILQVGEMPDTLMGHVKQRTRWTTGNIQMGWHIRLRLWGPAVKLCSFRQRLAGFTFGVGSTANSSLSIVSFFGLALALCSGYPFIVYSETWQLRWLLRVVCIWCFCDGAHKAALSLFVGYRDGMRWDNADSWLFPCECD